QTNLSTTFFEENHKLIRRSSLQGLTRDNPGKPPPTTHKSTNSQSIFISNSRTHQTAAAGAAALVVALYRPHLTKLSTAFLEKRRIFFPQTIWSILTLFQP
ncbi:hypothetical protein, partial [Brucella melitensis]